LATDTLSESSKNDPAKVPRALVGDLVTEMPFLVENSARQTLQIIREWIDQCDNDHSSCTLNYTTALPKKVLQLSSHSVYVRENLDSRAPYACLSHCWGRKGPDLRLTSETMKDLKEGVLISRLPKTFRDAVHVCQSLQISFLWIDALCKFARTKSVVFTGKD
jgi:hypothetical protein